MRALRVRAGAAVLLGAAWLAVPPVTDARAQPAPMGELNTLDELSGALQSCWRPPPDISRPGMEITVRFSFKRNGEIYGKPMITYQSPGATPEQRDAYRRAAADAIRRCARLPVSDTLGRAIAGRPISIKFTDQRNMKRAEAPRGQA